MKRTLLLMVIALRGMDGMLCADEEATDPATTARTRRVEKHLQGLKLEALQKAARHPVPLVDHALLTFSDPVRANVHGTLWAWGPQGRPKALIEVYQPSDESGWVHAVSLVSTDLVDLTIFDQRHWHPESTGIEFRAVPQSPRPESRETARLSQIKKLARRFEAYELWDPNNSRYELRSLVQPVHRYQDAGSGIIDGAIIVFAHGTNPEIVLIIEAQGQSPEQSEWKYALAKLGSAEMHVSLDAQEVWTEKRAPDVVGKPTDPYWLFFTEGETRNP